MIFLSRYKNLLLSTLAILLFLYSSLLFALSKEAYLNQANDYPDDFKYLDDDSKRDKDFIKTCIYQRLNIFRYIDPALKHNKAFVIELLKIGRYSTSVSIFKAMSDNNPLKQDADVLLAASNEYSHRFEDAPTALKNDRKFIRALLKISPKAIKLMNKQLKKDRKLVLSVVKQDGMTLEFVDPVLQKDRMVVLAAVKQNGEAIKFAAKPLRADKSIALAAIKNTGYVWDSIDKKLRKDPDIASIATIKNGIGQEAKYLDRKSTIAFVKNTYFGFEHINNRYKSDWEIILSAINKDNSAYKYIPAWLKKDRNLALASIAVSRHVVQYFEPPFKDDLELMRIAVSTPANCINHDKYVAKCSEQFSPLKHVSDRLKKNKSLVLTAVSMNGEALVDADPRFLDDKEIVSIAVKTAGSMYLYASKRLQNDKQIAHSAVQQYPYALAYAPLAIKKNRNIVLSAVTEKGLVLRYATDALKKDETLVLKAVKNIGLALEFADSSLRDNKKIVMAAIKSNPHALEFASDRLKQDKALVMLAINKDPDTFKYAGSLIKQDKTVVMEILKNKKSTLFYVDPLLKKDKQIVLKAIHYYAFAFLFADKQLKKDKQFVLTALKKNGHIFPYIDASLRHDADIIKLAHQVIDTPFPQHPIKISARERKNTVAKLLEKYNVPSINKYLDKVIFASSSIAISNDKRLLAAILKYKNQAQIVIWETKTGKVAYASAKYVNDYIYIDSLSAASFTPDNHRLIFLKNGDGGLVWSFAEGLPPVKAPLGNNILEVTNNSILTSFADAPIELYDLNTGEEIAYAGGTETRSNYSSPYIIINNDNKLFSISTRRLTQMKREEWLSLRVPLMVVESSHPEGKVDMWELPIEYTNPSTTNIPIFNKNKQTLLLLNIAEEKDKKAKAKAKVRLSLWDYSQRKKLWSINFQVKDPKELHIDFKSNTAFYPSWKKAKVINLKNGKISNKEVIH